MTLKYIVHIPTNHNDRVETYATLEEAITRVAQGDTYGDVIVRIEYTAYEDSHTTETHLSFTN